jgi:2-methylfumaryl-CoA hydratase
MTPTTKITDGNFFEDFSRGQIFHHAIPRTITEGDLALYIALTGDRRPLNCSSELGRALGFEREIAHDMLVFHIVFGRAVPDVSLNSPANRPATRRRSRRVSTRAPRAARNLRHPPQCG